MAVLTLTIAHKFGCNMENQYFEIMNKPILNFLQKFGWTRCIANAVLSCYSFVYIINIQNEIIIQVVIYNNFCFQLGTNCIKPISTVMHLLFLILHFIRFLM